MRKQDKEMADRIRVAVEKECAGCEYQDGKYCSWWQEKREGRPPCQTPG